MCDKEKIKFFRDSEIYNFQEDSYLEDELMKRRKREGVKRPHIKKDHNRIMCGICHAKRHQVSHGRKFGYLKRF